MNVELNDLFQELTTRNDWTVELWSSPAETRASEKRPVSIWQGREKIETI